MKNGLLFLAGFAAGLYAELLVQEFAWRHAPDSDAEFEARVAEVQRANLARGVW